MMKRLWVFLALAAFAGWSAAQVVTVKGVGTVTYAKEATAADKDKALRLATVSSVERYFAENGEAESQNFEAIQDQIEANLEKFILSTTVLNEQDQAGLRRYSVTVRTELNVAKLRNTLRSASNAGKASPAEKSQIVYVFVGREVASVRSFDARVVKRVETSVDASAKSASTTKGSEGENIKANLISTSASKQTSEKESANVAARIESGGSTTRKADDVSYRLLSMSNQKTSVTSVFSQAGFAVADPEFVLNDKEMKAVSQDYATGNDLSPSTIRSVVVSLRKSQVPLLALATFDVGAPSQDPATGMQRVAVSVTGRVLDVSAGMPREVASVPPVQYFGVGQDNQSAVAKALKDASIAAAREVVSRLNATGMR